MNDAGFDAEAPRLSVVMPCLNERGTLAAAVESARALIAASGLPGEIVIGDNGSTDGSQALAESLGARVAAVPRRGYGFAIMGGAAAARGGVIVMGDSDATYDFRDAAALVRAVDSGAADLAMGSRLRGRVEKGAMPFLHRRLGTPVLTFLIRCFFGLKITDCNCGLRAFSKSAFERMGLIQGGMEFASEMLAKAAACGLRVAEAPVSLSCDRRGRKPHLRTWRDGWRHLRFILLFAPHIVFALPGWALALGFGALSAAVLARPFHVSGMLVDWHHLFYAIPAFTTGCQLLWFAAFAGRFRRFVGGAEGAEPAREFPLERWLLAGAAALLCGAGVFAWLLAAWWRSGFGEFFAIRACALALVLVLAGVGAIANAMIISMLELNLARSR